MQKVMMKSTKVSYTFFTQSTHSSNQEPKKIPFFHHKVKFDVAEKNDP